MLILLVETYAENPHEPIVLKPPQMLIVPMAGLPMQKPRDFCIRTDIIRAVPNGMMAMTKGRRAAIYARVSKDERTEENQILALREVATRRGWDVVELYVDHGISGAKGRDKRPGFDRMLKDASKRKFDVVMAWAIDRIGRSLSDLLATIQHLEATGVDLYLDQQNVDTTTPAGKLLYHITGAFAEFERSMIQQRINAGLARARARGKRLGRPKIDAKTEAAIQEALASGKQGILKIAAAFGVGSGTVQRIKAASRHHDLGPQ
jgi:DNA invertase Pin-like site-specific DNA recombinase